MSTAPRNPPRIAARVRAALHRGRYSIRGVDHPNNRGARTRRPSSRLHDHHRQHGHHHQSRRAYAPPFIEARRRIRFPLPVATIAARVRAALHRGERTSVSGFREAAIAARVRAALHRGSRDISAAMTPALSRRAYAPPFIEARLTTVRYHEDSQIAARVRAALHRGLDQYLAGKRNLKAIAARVRAALHRGQAMPYSLHMLIIAARVRAALHRGGIVVSVSDGVLTHRGARTRRPSSRREPVMRKETVMRNRGARTRRPSSRLAVLALPGLVHQGDRGARTRRPSSRRRVRGCRRQLADHRGARTRRPSSRPVALDRGEEPQRSRRAYAPPFIEALPGKQHISRNTTIAARVRAALHRGRYTSGMITASDLSRRAYAPPFIEATGTATEARSSSIAARVRAALHRGA